MRIIKSDKELEDFCNETYKEGDENLLLEVCFIGIHFSKDMIDSIFRYKQHLSQIYIDCTFGDMPTEEECKSGDPKIYRVYFVKNVRFLRCKFLYIKLIVASAGSWISPEGYVFEKKDSTLSDRYCRVSFIDCVGLGDISIGGRSTSVWIEGSKILIMSVNLPFFEDVTFNILNSSIGKILFDSSVTRRNITNNFLSIENTTVDELSVGTTSTPCLYELKQSGTTMRSLFDDNVKRLCMKVVFFKMDLSNFNFGKTRMINRQWLFNRCNLKNTDFRSIAVRYGTSDSLSNLSFDDCENVLQAKFPQNNNITVGDTEKSDTGDVLVEFYPTLED